MRPSAPPILATITAIFSFTSCSCLRNDDGFISLDPNAYELKFRAVETEFVGTGEITYTDLDGDGIDERILVSAGESPNQSLVLATTQTRAVINQITLPPTSAVSYCFADDINADAKKDLFVVAREKDTVVAYVIDIFSSKVVARFPLLSKTRHLDALPRDASATMAGLVNTATLRVSRERIPSWLVICVYTSTSKLMQYEPRGIAAFDIATGRQEWYFPTAAWPSEPIIKDANGDGLPEIFLAANAPANGVAANGRDDLHCYLFAFSIDGTLLWERTLGGQHSVAAITLVESETGRGEILCTYKSSHVGSQESYVARFDAMSGNSLAQKSIDKRLVPGSGVLTSEDGFQLITCTESGTIRLLRRDLEALHYKELGAEVERFQALDVVADETKEIVVSLRSTRKVILNHKLEPLSLIDSGLAFSVVHQRDIGTSGQARKSLALHAHGVAMRGTLEPDSVPAWRWVLFVLLAIGTGGTIYGFYRAFFYLQLYLTISRNTSQLATIVLTRRGHILHINDAAMNLLGLSGNFRGRQWQSCFLQVHHEPVLQFLDSAMGSSKPSEEFLNLPAPQKESGLHPPRITMLARVQPIFSGRLRLGSLLVFDNLTEVVRWAAVAQNLAHEMKTPLSTIWFTLERMRQQARETLTPDELEEHTASISAELRRLDAYIKGFMKIANLNPPNLQLNDVSAVLADLLETYSRKLPSLITLVRDFSDSLPSIKLDVNLFTAATINLLDNAVNAMRGSGVLRVSTFLSLAERLAHGLESSAVCISVSDSGPGIAEEDIPRIFTPYFSRTKDGTGLGLMITRKIVEEHGGKIEFSTRTDGQGGTEFVIRLPVPPPHWDGSGNARDNTPG
ncbi:MAG: ATP-binding protein [Bacteroidota bacterium]